MSATPKPIDKISEEDLDLLRQAKEGDAEAYSVLFNKCKKHLHKIALLILSDYHLVDDILQEIFVESFRKISTYDSSKGEVVGWLITMTRRRSIDLSRKKIAYRKTMERFTKEYEVTSEGSTDHFDHHQRIAYIEHYFEEALKKIRQPHHKKWFEMQIREGLSHKEIAQRERRPLGTVKTGLALALKQVLPYLKKNLQEYQTQ